MLYYNDMFVFVVQYYVRHARLPVLKYNRGFESMCSLWLCCGFTHIRKIVDFSFPPPSPQNPPNSVCSSMLVFRELIAATYAPCLLSLLPHLR